MPDKYKEISVSLLRETEINTAVLRHTCKIDVQSRLLDSVGEGKGGIFRENSMKTCILSIVKQIASPGWMHETSAQAWCIGKTQRNRVGNKCKSISDSCQCMTKTTTIL